MELCKAFNPNSSQVTVLGVNDETLGVIGNPGYVFDAIELQQGEVLHRESYFCRILLEAITNWRWKSSR
jgi:hypothetical protein